MNRSPYATGLLFSVATILVGVGCSSGGRQSGDAGMPGAGLVDARQPANTGRYIPLAVGAGWTWNGFDTLSGLSGLTDSRVEALETLTGAKAGISAYRIRSVTLSGSTVNWQQDTGTSVVRHREQFFGTTGALTTDHLFTPEKLRLDEDPSHIVLGASWTEMYSDAVTAPAAQPATTATVTWTVEAVDEMVSVPAGYASSSAIPFRDFFVGRVKEMRATGELTVPVPMPLRKTATWGSALQDVAGAAASASFKALGGEGDADAAPPHRSRNRGTLQLIIFAMYALLVV
jgi:hypothetical protein